MYPKSTVGSMPGNKKNDKKSGFPYLGVILLKLDAGRRFFAQRGRRGSSGCCARDHGKVFLQHTGKSVGEARRQHLKARLFVRRHSSRWLDATGAVLDYITNPENKHFMALH